MLLASYLTLALTFAARLMMLAPAPALCEASLLTVSLLPEITRSTTKNS